MDPLGRGPLLALSRGAAGVQAGRVGASIGLQAVEQQGVATHRLDCEAFLSAVAPLGAVDL